MTRCQGFVEASAAFFEKKAAKKRLIPPGYRGPTSTASES
jgi:hypothetical protein